MNRYYVSAILVIDAPTAQGAVNQVALLPLDFQGEPYAAEDVQVEIDDDIKPVTPSDWTIPDPPERDLFQLLRAWFETRRAANKATPDEDIIGKLEEKYGAACDELADVVALMLHYGEVPS